MSAPRRWVRYLSGNRAGQAEEVPQVEAENLKATGFGEYIDAPERASEPAPEAPPAPAAKPAGRRKAEAS